MGIWGFSKSDAGVQGDSEASIGVVGFGNDGYGVLGFSDGNAGVVGRSERSVGVWGDVQNDAGVLGTSNRGAGVAGYSQSSEGVHGESAADVGVKGFSQGVIGVFGESPNGLGILGRSLTGAGVTGQSNAAAGVFGGSNAGPGVSGESTTDVGVVGRSPQIGVVGEGANRIGVYGRSARGVGVRGHSADGVGVLGSVSDPKGLAGQFKGNVLVDGDFTVTGAKGAVVPHPDGSHRLFCAIESPESWFEDFGEGTLEGGRAEIALDADFAQLVHADRYHVFLTPYGPTSGLYVDKRTADRFVVREQQEGKSRVPFSYRVVAKRRDIDVPRLKKMPPPPEVSEDVRGDEDENETGAAPEQPPRIEEVIPPRRDARDVASPGRSGHTRDARLSIEKPGIEKNVPRK